MATLLEQLQSATDGSSLSADIGGQAGNFLQIVQLVKQLIDEPPGDFSGYLSHLQSLPLPEVSIGGDLGAAFSGILPALQGDTSGLLEPLLGAVGSIGESIGGMGATFSRLLSVIRDLQTLFASDLSCGLVAALAPLPATETPAEGGGGEPPAEPATPATPAAPLAVLSTDQITKAKAMVEALPADMTVPSLLKWLHQFVGTHRPGYFYFRSIPVVDDLRDPLDTLVRWDGFDGAALMAELSGTLGALTTIVGNNTVAVVNQAFTSPAVSAIPATAMAAGAGQLADALDALRTAVEGADTGAISTHLTTAQNAAAAVETANLTLDAQVAALELLTAALDALPSRLETAICRLLVLLQPRAAWGDLTSRLGEAPTVLSNDTFAPVTELLGRVQEFLENLLNLVDISAVTEPLTNIFTQAAQAIDQVEQGIVQAVTTVRAAFERAHEALQLLDIEHAQQQAEQALAGATEQVGQALSQGLGPAVDALMQALNAIDGVLGDFDPEQLGAPIRQVFDAISAIFQSPPVQEIVTQLQRLQDLAEQLDALSFQPVSNVVIEGIGTVKSALDAIDESTLVAPLPEMLGQAMSVLPESLTPLTDSLITGLDQLIDQGPIPLLEAVRDLPEPIFEHLQSFSPRDLLQEPLGKPFKEMREKLDDFQPTQWLDVVEQELDALKQRLADAIDVQILLAPIMEARQLLLDELGNFRPGAVLEPLTQGIETALQSLDTALPTQELTDGLQSIFSQVRRLTDTLDAANQVVQSISTKLALLADPDAQLTQWLDEILAKLPADAPTTLATALTSLRQAVDNAKSAPMQSAYATARQPLLNKLNEADAQALQTRIVQGKARLTPLVSALPASTAKSDLEAWLTAFDPAGPTFSRGLRGLARLAGKLTDTDTAMTQIFGDWDARYHRNDGVLAALTPESFSLEELRQWLREAVDRQLGRPVLGFLKQLKVLGALLQTFGDTIGSLLQAVNDKLDALLAAPEALLQAMQELEELKTQLTNLDLDMFTREIDGLYTQLMDQLRALDPSSMETALREVLTQALDVISLDLVFTPGLRQQLEETYATLLGAISGLDPELLIIRPMEETYEQDILPLAEALDVGEAIQAIIDLLNRLPDDLQAELGRVNTAYQQMLAAAPSGGSGAGASASLSI